MPSQSFFHHHLRIALHNATELLKKECKKKKSIPLQESFNTTVQIPAMDRIKERIFSYEGFCLNMSDDDWSSLERHINQVIEKEVEQCRTELTAKNQINKDKTGSSIDMSLIIRFGDKITSIYQEISRQISQDLFLAHRDQDSEKYIHKSYNKSPLFNQLINIAIGYQFNKIQEKNVYGKQSFTPENIGKFNSLTHSIHGWKQVVDNKIEPAGFIIEAILKLLIAQEHQIEYGVSEDSSTMELTSGYTKQAFSSVASLSLFGGGKKKEDHSSLIILPRLGTSLPLLVKEYLSIPESLSLPEYQDRKGEESTRMQSMNA